jgi:hypothetical protein
MERESRRQSVETDELKQRSKRVTKPKKPQNMKTQPKPKGCECEKIGMGTDAGSLECKRMREWWSNRTFSTGSLILFRPGCYVITSTACRSFAADLLFGSQSGLLQFVRLVVGLLWFGMASPCSVFSSTAAWLQN